MGFTNSTLATYVRLTSNKTTNRKQNITRITPHCFVGQITAKEGCDYFATTNRDVSSNYVIGHDGSVGLSVEEKDRSWCSSDSDNDNRAVTIECASGTSHPYAFTDACYNKLIDLCADICKRNGKTKLVWFRDKKTALDYKPAANEMVLTVHRWFALKACPGDWMFSRMEELAAKVNAKLNFSQEHENKAESAKSYYCVQVGAYTDLNNAKNMVERLKAAGFDSIIKTATGGQITDATVEPVEESFKFGDKVKLQKGAPQYGKTEGFQSWVYDAVLYVRVVNGSRVIISTLKNGAITGVVDKKFLTKI